MFCTGGIRCEKSTAYLKSEGFENVFHLQGGILKYLEEVKEDESLWEGECFVFDDRVAVKHIILSLENMTSAMPVDFQLLMKIKSILIMKKEPPVPRCYGTKNSSQVSRYREREKQVQLAKSRGESHIGDDANKVIAKNNKYN